MNTYDKKPLINGNPDESPVLFLWIYLWHTSLWNKAPLLIFKSKNLGMSILLLVWFTHDPVRNCKTVVITAEVDSTSVHSTSFMFENVCALCGWSVVPGFPGGFPMIYGLWFTRLLAPSFIS